MLNLIDTFLNKMTMYRLMMYGLLLEVAYAVLLSVGGVLSFSPLHLLGSFLILVCGGYGINLLIGKLFHITTNTESSVIAGMLLFLIVDPTITSLTSVGYLVFASALLQASKYIFAIGRRHVFNPVAITLVVLYIFQIPLGIWWVANAWMLPFVFVFGMMVARKTRRTNMVLVFFFVATSVALWNGISLRTFLLSWPVVYFGTMMLTEPRTAPSRERDRLIYAVIAGGIFSSLISVWIFSSTPEVALVVGNLFAFFVSETAVLRLTLKRQSCETEQICHFVFEADRPLGFDAGQYLEWMLDVPEPDSRGNRRYFTIASAPSEKEIDLGVRIDRARSSAFKQQLLQMKPGDSLVASHPSGDFTLCADITKPLVWIAGGIGITPFRSMARELVARKEKRNIDLFYCVNKEDDIAYKREVDIWKIDAGIETTYVVANPTELWSGETGKITEALIKKAVPDFLERTFYFSGPPMMVQSYVKLVRSMGVYKKQIKTDYFPGF